MGFDPERFVAEVVRRLAPERLLARIPLERLVGPRVALLALGKPAAAYLRALRARLGERVVRAISVGPRGSGVDHEGGHPVPNAGSFEAGIALREFVRAVPADCDLLCFVAGGGSALAEIPRAPFTSEEIVERTRVMLHSGVSIGELNAVRRSWSDLKAGRLLDGCRARRVLSLVLCDVPSGDLATVASGPTLPGEAIRVGGFPELAAAAVAALRAQQVAAIDLVAPALDMDLAAGIELHRAWIARHARPAPWALVSGGELPTRVRGTGRGGRNSEFAVRLARLLGAGWTVLALATDGADGSSDAAGGVVTGEALARVDPEPFLARSDSATLIEELGIPLRPGPTATNLMDLRVVLRAL